MAMTQHSKAAVYRSLNRLQEMNLIRDEDQNGTWLPNWSAPSECYDNAMAAGKAAQAERKRRRRKPRPTSNIYPAARYMDEFDPPGLSKTNDLSDAGASKRHASLRQIAPKPSQP
jgi:hypothetical protein